MTKHVGNKTVGAARPTWKGDNASIAAMHSWIRYHYGRATHCETCDTKNAKVYDWSNKSGNYLRDPSDWQQLCRKCHIAYDKHYARKRKTSHPTTSHFKGVSLHRKSGKWISMITDNGLAIYLGSFDNETEAAIAYDSAVLMFRGSNAYFNFPQTYGK